MIMLEYCFQANKQTNTQQLRDKFTFGFSFPLLYIYIYIYIYVTVYGKTGHNAACVNIEKRSIDFLKMHCFKPTEGNG